LEDLTGYFRSRFESDPKAKANLIRDFPSRDITYLVGDDDKYNCKLSKKSGIYICILNIRTCLYIRIHIRKYVWIFIFMYINLLSYLNI
jgi:hypothetical protein